MTKWLLLFLLAAICLGCGGTTHLPPIEVGHVADRTGPNRSAGIQAERGIGLALDEVNKDAKRPIRVPHPDTQGKRDAFESHAVRLVAVNQVKAIIGGNSPEELLSLDAGRVLGTEEQPGFLPILSPCGWRAPGTSNESIPIGMSPQAQGKVLARFTAQELKADKITILVKQPADSAQFLVDAFKLEFHDAYLALNPEISSAPTPQLLSYGKGVELSDLLSRINEPKKLQAVLLVGPTQDLRWLSEVWAQPQPALIYGGPDGSLSAAEWNTAMKIYFASAFAIDKDNADFVERYRKLHQQDPDVHTALAYEAMKLLGHALERSNNDPATLRTELFKIKDLPDQSLPGLAGPLGFDEKQQLRRSLFVLRLENSMQTQVQKYRP